MPCVDWFYYCHACDAYIFGPEGKAVWPAGYNVVTSRDYTVRPTIVCPDCDGGTTFLKDTVVALHHRLARALRIRVCSEFADGTAVQPLRKLTGS